jgi:hypothetical protein
MGILAESQPLEPMADAPIGFLGRRGVLHQYRVAGLGPEGWQETKVVAQLAAGVRRGEIGKVGSQCYVVFRIKDM